MAEDEPGAVMNRPELNVTLSADDFRAFYFLKDELLHFCRDNGLSTAGSKLELAERIEVFLSSGERLSPLKVKYRTDGFDWGREKLTPSTTITPGYRNTENVRAFMIAQIGSHFRFNTTFMNWVKGNSGKTLGDAIQEWQRIHALNKCRSQLSSIAPQFEYNTYIRQFLQDNPERTLRDAIKFWKIKRTLRGPNRYNKEDLLLIKE